MLRMSKVVRCGHQHPDPRAGFTLLELSIVLLTVGLLIFFGLMHLSEMRRLTTRNPLQCQQNLKWIRFRAGNHHTSTPARRPVGGWQDPGAHVAVSCLA